MAVTIKSATTIKGNMTVGFSPASLFAAGEQGVWYDPSDFSTMFQDTAGATPVTAVEQSVGLLLDKRNTNFSTAFNGTNALLSVAANSAFTFGTGAFTVEAWIYLTAYSTLATMVCANTLPTGANNAFRFIIDTATRKITIGTWNVALATSTNIISLNTWTHVAASFDGTTYRVFINGALEGSGTTTYNLSAVNDFNVGYSGDSGNPFRFTGNINNLRVVKGTAVYTSSFTVPGAPLSPISGTSILTCGTSWSGNPTITNTNTTSAFVSPFGTGNHATQSTAGNRPVLSARVNLLTKTQDFGDAAWTKLNATASTTTAVNDPLGGTTASILTDDATSGTHRAYQQVTIVSGTSITASVSIKAGTCTKAVFGVGDNSNFRFYAAIDLSAGTITQSGVASAAAGAALTSSSITPQGNGWYRISLVGTVAAGQTTCFPSVALSNSDTPGGLPSYSGTGTTIYVWGEDFRVSNDGVGLPVYQRVNTSTDYDTTGFPFYLAFNGTSSFLSAGNVCNLGTNDFAVFSGTTILNSSSPIIAKARTGSDVGRWWLTTVASKYSVNYENAATVVRTAEGPTNTSVTPQVTAGIMLRSAGTGSIRTNGSQVGTTSFTAESANIGNTLRLLIGAYADAAGTGQSVYLSGRIYSIIARLSTCTSDQITATESWVNTKTRAY